VTTPRTAPTSKTRTPAQPAKKPVMFDVAEAEQEFDASERPAPFTVRLRSGKVVTFVDPAALDWQVAFNLDARYPNLILQTLVPAEDLEDVYAEEMRLATVRRLLDDWRAHYKVDLSVGE
jgi:hypothetical protein